MKKTQTHTHIESEDTFTKIGTAKKKSVYEATEEALTNSKKTHFLISKHQSERSMTK